MPAEDLSAWQIGLAREQVSKRGLMPPKSKYELSLLPPTRESRKALSPHYHCSSRIDTETGGLPSGLLQWNQIVEFLQSYLMTIADPVSTTHAGRQAIIGLTRAELAEWCASVDEPAYRA